MNILEVIRGNLTAAAVVIALIFLFQLGNMIFGIYKNVLILKENFNWEKIRIWAIKAGLALLGVAIFVVGISLIPAAIEYIGITIPEEYEILVNFSCVLLVAWGTLKNEVLNLTQKFPFVYIQLQFFLNFFFLFSNK